MNSVKNMQEHNNNKIRVLQVTGTLGLGGAETMVMNLYRSMDPQKIEFDFAVNGKDHYYYENFIPSDRSTVYHITKRSESFCKHHIELYKIIKNNGYKTIHFHTQNAFTTSLQIIVARLAGVKNIIVHCHNTMDWRNKKLLYLSKLFRPILCGLANYRLSCGEDAAKWLYGNNGRIEIIPLPVDCKKYRYSDSEYRMLKKGMGLSDTTVYTHIGRFSEVKNQSFVISIFRELLKSNPKSVLFLIGDGKMKEQIMEKAETMGIQEKIYFWGNIDDVHTKLKMTDVFLLPSLYEGFPTVVLEAQAAGVPCVISNTITPKIAITNLVEFLDISSGISPWVDVLKEYKEIPEIDKHKANDIIAQTYDISVVVRRIEEIYQGR